MPLRSAWKRAARPSSRTATYGLRSNSSTIRPPRADSFTAHAVVTGEPDDRETIKSGSAGAERKRDQLRLAPRRSADPSSWLMLHRRLARGYETLPTNSAAVIHIAMTDLMTLRLTGCGGVW
ncbi:hypothetical protein F9B16_11490 [Actinomadura montaniterrae]|uniref:Transposase n=1 Tax=Actinomadura montaniterrae TaxID=1803903 RepID=A0A6L3W1S3_9ACTN|nr:hypothetical protein F9B16_11490 [Actinomadura montaniterrae]